MALEKLEMHDVQDKTRLMDEMNETRDGVNEALAAVNELKKELRLHTTPPPGKPLQVNTGGGQLKAKKTK